MLDIVSILKYPFMNGIFLPFKIYNKSSVVIRRSAKLHLKSRLTIGSSDRLRARVSALPTNLYFGYKSDVTFGESVTIGPGVNIIVKDNAIFSVGQGTYFTSDMHVETVNNIEIGSNCAISWGTTIIDDDHHEIQYAGKAGSETKYEVKIGDRVWIGCNCIILKGTILGDNCVVAAGSVVKGTFPPNCLIGGNPAKIIKEDVSWK
jgi:acetyltransferase-like isoleucine patch superfamily enzyme